MNFSSCVFHNTSAHNCTKSVIHLVCFYSGGIVGHKVTLVHAWQRVCVRLRLKWCEIHTFLYATFRDGMAWLSLPLCEFERERELCMCPESCCNLANGASDQFDLLVGRTRANTAAAHKPCQRSRSWSRRTSLLARWLNACSAFWKRNCCCFAATDVSLTSTFHTTSAVDSHSSTAASPLTNLKSN